MQVYTNQCTHVSAYVRTSSPIITLVHPPLGSGKELPPQVATDVTTTPGMLSANNRTLEANSYKYVSRKALIKAVLQKMYDCYLLESRPLTLYAALRDSTKFLEFELKDPTTALSNTFLKFWGKQQNSKS